MQEKVGTCKNCGRTLYCMDGFFNGVKEDGATYCFECAEEKEKE
ncbi:hypothetical protein [Bacillus thermotolerans]|uniref:GapA-binding peptide SR1P n=1 Tax=Bacillus thermotolerans TaxID=1221996 RepID=A0A0F5HUD0_BACTR|nr:hypothetical protein [Bacillus thermotolerans]KKB36462.1 hypothetical protein QY97_00861 [Bacillus thermotolerans]KKB40133.1 hypothetical protein QY96_02494 [Bacillus thermotolerans]KKB41068.1 hypothetical protein QY95_01131 [Bacillus thermotolerans]